jgi:hypothetical protein
MNRLALLLLLAAAPMLPAQQLVATDALPSAPSFLQAAQTPAQSASLTGTVTDTAGALVPGAAIVLEAPGQPARHTTTDAAGRFTLTGLPPANWHAVVAAIGLESQTTPPFILQPGERLELPTIALAIANATESVLVSGNSVEVAEAELNLETQQRTLGIIPNFRTSYIWNAAPLDAHQKYKLAYRTLSDPFSLFGFALSAYIETNNDTYPQWGRDAPSYGKRFGAGIGDSLFSRGFDTAVFPALFHQDPRYFYMGPAQPIRKRLIHAIETGIITRGDNGHLQPNYSHFAGNAAAGALSTVYHPASTNAGQLALTNTLLRIGFDGLDGLLREFVIVHLVRHKAPYANGEPAGTP